MPYNGIGQFSLSQPAFVAGTTISSAAVNADLSDIATNGLSLCVTTNGQSTITGPLKAANGTAAAPSFTFSADTTTGMFYLGSNHLGFSTGGVEIAAFNANNLGTSQNGNVLEINTSSGIAYPCPVGSVIDFAGTTAPSGWFLCYGQALSATSYPELFQVLGTTYGISAGNVVLPDCRGRATYGQDNMGGSAANRITVAGGNFDGTVLGGVGGGQNSVLTQAQLPAVAPTFTGNAGGITGTFTGQQNTWSTNQSGSPNVGITTVATPGGAFGLLSNAQADFTITITPAGSISINNFTPTGSISNLGSGSSHPILGPAIIFNKIIYAGRP